MCWIHPVKMKQMLDTVNLNTVPTFVSSSSVPLVGSSRASSHISQGSSSSDKDVKRVRLFAWGATFISSELCCGTVLLLSTTINNRCWLPHRVQYTPHEKSPCCYRRIERRNVCRTPPPKHPVLTIILNIPLMVSSCLFINLPYQRLVTSWMVQGSNPGGGEIFHTHPDRPWDPPSPIYNGYQVSFLGVNWPGQWPPTPI